MPRSPELARARTGCVTVFVDVEENEEEMALELNFLVGKLGGLPTSATGASKVEFVVRTVVDPGFVDRIAA